MRCDRGFVGYTFPERAWFANGAQNALGSFRVASLWQNFVTSSGVRTASSRGVDANSGVAESAQMPPSRSRQVLFHISTGYGSVLFSILSSIVLMMRSVQAQQTFTCGVSFRGDQQAQRKIKSEAYYVEKKGAKQIKDKAEAEADLSAVAPVLEEFGF